MRMTAKERWCGVQCSSHGSAICVGALQLRNLRTASSTVITILKGRRKLWRSHNCKILRRSSEGYTTVMKLYSCSGAVHYSKVSSVRTNLVNLKISPFSVYKAQPRPYLQELSKMYVLVQAAGCLQSSEKVRGCVLNESQEILSDLRRTNLLLS